MVVAPVSPKVFNYVCVEWISCIRGPGPGRGLDRMQKNALFLLLCNFLFNLQHNFSSSEE